MVVCGPSGVFWFFYSCPLPNNTPELNLNSGVWEAHEENSYSTAMSLGSFGTRYERFEFGWARRLTYVRQFDEVDIIHLLEPSTSASNETCKTVLGTADGVSVVAEPFPVD